MRSLRWAIIQHDWSTYKKRTKKHTEGKPCEEREDQHGQSNEKGLRRNQPCQCFCLGLLGSNTVRRYISIV